MPVDQQKKPQQITIELTPEAADGVFANLTIITHSPSEFILDFARLLPGVPKAKVHARVILTPASAKMLARSLAENIERFEKIHGDIRLPGPQESHGPIGFQTEQ
jgi:hypothetical protein